MCRWVAKALSVLLLWSVIGTVFGLATAVTLIPEPIKEVLALIVGCLLFVALFGILTWFLYDQLRLADLTEWFEKKLRCPKEGQFM